LEDVNAKVRREEIFKPPIGIGSLNEINNDNMVRVVNYATSKISVENYYNVPTTQPS
jgi:hypothetical protein